MDLQLPSFPIFLCLLLVFFIVLKILTNRSKAANSQSPKLPPGPWKLPLLGNLHQLVVSGLLHHTLRDLAKKYGPFMYLKLGQIPTIVVSSPEFAKEVMKAHDADFASRPTNLLSRIMLYDNKDVVFAPYGEYWRQLRKICVQEVLSSSRVQSYKPIREEEMSNLVELVASNQGYSVNLTKAIRSTTYEITSRAALGKKRGKDREEVISIVEEVVELGGKLDLSDMFPSFSFLLNLISPIRSKFERVHRKADRILDKIIKEHIEEKSSGKNCETEDLVDVLLRFHENGDHLGFTLTDDSIKGVIWDVFSAGSETSSTATDWAMAEMIKNPRVMKKAQDEVREVFRRKGSVDETAINDMKYLKAVVKETLRLHPSVPLLIPRESIKKCEINGYEIPEKTRVLVNAWAIGRDPRYWAEPESFMPERFVDRTIDFKGTDFEYIPFGSGRRICPGILYGIINVELPLAMLLYYFDWKLPNGMEPEELDMSESFGITVGRKQELNLIPIAYDFSITN